MKSYFFALLSLVLMGESVTAQSKPSRNSAPPAPSKYFVIQNIATEKTRVYERCTETADCPHRLVFEADTVVGRPEVGTKEDPNAFKTWVGHGKISKWIKFYQDGAGHYPHWYKEGQDLSTIPPRAPRNSEGKPESSIGWGSQWKTKVHGKSTIYGAFGWYAAKLTPESAVGYQWMHGTMGWGSDGDAAIQLTRSTFLNIFSNPGSSGCTRLSNASIAYLRHLLPTGTDVYRVYAQESSREPSCLSYSFSGRCKKHNVFPRYAEQVQSLPWNFTMLTDGAQKAGGLTADAATIAAQNIAVLPGVNLIEQGTIQIDQYPTPVQRNYNHAPSSGKTGDRYEIDSPTGNSPSRFQGYFLVEEGRFIDYRHPKAPGKVIIGGTAEFRASMPNFLTTSGSHQPPEVVYSRNNGSDEINP